VLDLCPYAEVGESAAISSKVSDAARNNRLKKRRWFLNASGAGCSGTAMTICRSLPAGRDIYQTYRSWALTSAFAAYLRRAVRLYEHLIRNLLRRIHATL